MQCVKQQAPSGTRRYLRQAEGMVQSKTLQHKNWTNESCRLSLANKNMVFRAMEFLIKELPSIRQAGATMLEHFAPHPHTLASPLRMLSTPGGNSRTQSNRQVTKGQRGKDITKSREGGVFVEHKIFNQKSTSGLLWS